MITSHILYVEESVSKNSSENTSMEQVRELLMGTQLKDMENRILRQEERFKQELSDLREAMKNRVGSLENFMKSESGSLLHRLQEEKSERSAALKNEQRERAETLKSEHKDRLEAAKQERREREEAEAQLGKELAKQEDAFERKLAALSATLDAFEKDLRQLLLTESTRLSSATEEKYNDALSALARATEQLRHDLVSRSSLSAVFTENAVRLAGNLTLSESEKIVAEASGGTDADAAGA